MDRPEFTLPVLVMSENLKFARDAFARLSAEEKAVLLQEMVGNLGQQVILGSGNFITADVVLQIHSGDVDLSEILKAAAHRVSKCQESVDRGSN